VFFHSTTSYATANHNFLGSLIRHASSVGVPLFVMISGYFLLSSSKNESCGYFYPKRLKRIGIPLLFWSFFYILVDFALTIWKGGEIKLLEWKSWYIWLCSGTPGGAYHLWYLYMILGLYACTPFLVTLYNRYSSKVILSLICVLYSTCFFQYARGGGLSDSFILLRSINYIPYFFLGRYLGSILSTREKVSQEKRKIIRITSIFLFCIATLLETWICWKFNSIWILGNLSFLVVLQTISVYSFILSIQTTPCKITENFFKWISSLTFGIYLAHVFFLSFFYAVFNNITGDRLTIAWNIALALVTFIVSALSTVIMKRIPYLRACV